jgi:hypothetical protein
VVAQAMVANISAKERAELERILRLMTQRGQA